jgi:hypothetical protein
VFPGRLRVADYTDISDAQRRSVVADLVRYYGWRYDPRPGKKGGHGMLYPPDGGRAQPVSRSSASNYVRMQWLAALRAKGAPIEPNGVVVKPEREYVAPQHPTFSHIESHLSDGEWRQTYDGGWAKAPKQVKPVGPARTPSRVEQQATRVLDRLEEFTPKPQLSVDLDDRRRGVEYELGHARAMFRQGYPLKFVVQRTGWGAYWLADMAGEDGYCLPEHRRNGRVAS